MKSWLPHLLLACLVLAGFVHTSRAEAVFFDFEAGPASASATAGPYHDADCEGVKRHFQQNPVPIGAIDVATGDEIVGYEIFCPMDVVLSEGAMEGPGGERFVPREWGGIRVKYAP
jgi:hypothetical protein